MGAGRRGYRMRSLCDLHFSFLQHCSLRRRGSFSFSNSAA